MKLRTVSAIVLAAGLTVGASGCSLIAPVATSIPYAPSDGIDVTVGGADVRNMMLIADESGENFNVVFTGVNTGSEDIELTVNMEHGGSGFASAEFTLEPGTTLFGDPEGEMEPTLVPLDDVQPGETVAAFFQVAGEDEVEHNIPVLDGTLQEYRDFVIDGSGSADATEGDSASEGVTGVDPESEGEADSETGSGNATGTGSGTAAAD
ncbi:hypothetical protein GCM10009847_12430 [Leucobacter tardus]|uniref:DNA modification methylase n=1 Tax=Leucobacter tardus TaxID=501483 RepID=A0A939QIH4_9MICO|nr:DNA modification methylase [Leucobacter tardus]MBO2989434.1 DNA modification methylase [Leucobacter tardus]